MHCRQWICLVIANIKYFVNIIIIIIIVIFCSKRISSIFQNIIIIIRNQWINSMLEYVHGIKGEDEIKGK